MPPLPPFTPFPTPYQIGTDICSIPRVLAILKGNCSHRLENRILRPEERPLATGLAVQNWAAARLRLNQAAPSVADKSKRLEIRNRAAVAAEIVRWRRKHKGVFRLTAMGNRKLSPIFVKPKDILPSPKLQSLCEEEYNADTIDQARQDGVQRGTLSVMFKQQQNLTSGELEETTPKKRDGDGGWMSKVRRIVIERSGATFWRPTIDPTTEEVPVKVETDIAGNETGTENTEKMSEATESTKEDVATRDMKPLVAEIAHRKAWLVNNGYRREATAQRPIFGEWDTMRTRKVVREEKLQRQVEHQAITFRKTAGWFFRKRKEMREQRRLRHTDIQWVKLRKELSSGDTGGRGVETIPEEINKGAVHAEEVVYGTGIVSQQSALEKVSYSGPLEPPPISEVAQNNLQDRRKTEGEEWLSEQKTSAPDVSSTTPASNEPAEPAPNTSTPNLSDADEIGSMSTELSQQNKTHPDGLDIAKKCQQPLIRRTNLKPSFRGKQSKLTVSLSRTAASLVNIMHEEGIVLRPEEITTLAGEWDLLKSGQGNIRNDSTLRSNLKMRHEKELEAGPVEVPQAIEDALQRQQDDMSDVPNEQAAEEAKEGVLEEMNTKETAKVRRIEEAEREFRIAEAKLWKAAQFLAGRFAAKEAIIKAHRSRRLTFHDILILKPEPKQGETRSQAPFALVMPEPSIANGGVGMVGKGNGKRERLPKEVRISISHDGDYVTAVCLAVDE